MSSHSASVAATAPSKPHRSILDRQSLPVLCILVSAALTLRFASHAPLLQIARGIIAAAVAAPLRRASIVLQTQDSDPRVASGALERRWSICGCISTLWKEQGFLSLWRGLSALLASTVILEFADMLQAQVMPQWNSDWGPLGEPLLGGGGSGADLEGSGSGAAKWGSLLQGCVTLLAVAVGSQALAYPFVLVYTALSAEVGQAPQFEGVGGCVQSVWRTHGVRGLYTGFRLLCMEAAGRVLLGYGARGYAAIVAPKLLSGPLALMEEMMTKIMTEQEMGRQDERDMSVVDQDAPWRESRRVMWLLATLLLADGLGWVALYGLNTVRNRMISQVGSIRQRYDSAVHCINMAWQQEGAGAFLKGVTASVLLVGCTAAVRAWLTVRAVHVHIGESSLSFKFSTGGGPAHSAPLLE